MGLPKTPASRMKSDPNLFHPPMSPKSTHFEKFNNFYSYNCSNLAQYTSLNKANALAYAATQRN